MQVPFNTTFRMVKKLGLKRLTAILKPPSYSDFRKSTKREVLSHYVYSLFPIKSTVILLLYDSNMMAGD
jgi:hypothetical protein